jgi:hypothetical protein
MRPARLRSTGLSKTKEAALVEFRQRTRLPLGDFLGCLRETVPGRSRSALHGCR